MAMSFSISWLVWQGLVEAVAFFASLTAIMSKLHELFSENFNMSTIGELNHLPSPKSAKVPWKYEGANLVGINSDELIGIEVEVENAQFIGKVSSPWIAKDDGSLRNNGVELITEPIAASLAPVALYHLMAKVLSSECSFSMRTSIHIHLNATDMTEQQVRDFVALYTIFEPALFNFAGRGRYKSVFCVPLNECNQIHHTLGRRISDGRWEKYTSLNLRRLADLGTLEFRHMAGTFDVDRVSNWIGIICRIKQYVMVTGSKDIRSEIAQLTPYSDYNNLAARVFQEFSPLLRVSDPSIYYPASLNAREVLSTRAEIYEVQATSPLLISLSKKRSV